jgi:hypothetical protein
MWLASALFGWLLIGGTLINSSISYLIHVI